MRRRVNRNRSICSIDGSLAQQSFEITAASDDTLNDHVITLDAIQQEIITHRERA